MTVDQEPARTVGRFQGMMRPVWRFSARLAALYVLVELAALALLTWAFGLGWTLLVLFATFRQKITFAMFLRRILNNERKKGDSLYELDLFDDLVPPE